MQKFFSFIVAISGSLIVFGQRSIDSLVQTEKNFAKTSLVSSTAEAFMKFIDTSGIVFDKGKPVNGLEFYTKSDKRKPGILSWEPEYAEISSANDFGYTTGPWKFYQNSLKEPPIARGYFVTVWHLNDRDKWKFLIDFGITCGKTNKKGKVKKSSTANLKLEKEAPQSLNETEEEFIQSYRSQGVGAYESFLSSQSRLNYSGFLPAANANERKVLLDSLPQNINYTILGSGMSPAKDLGYVYGSSIINDKHDGYLRIWRREGDAWKIAVEVLHFK